MTVQPQVTKTDVKNIALQIKESADLELVKAKGVLKQNETSGTGWLAHLSKILEVFEAIDKSNELVEKEHTQLDKGDFLQETLYNALSNCTSLDQLESFFNTISKSDGALCKANPAFAAYVGSLGNAIANDIKNFQKKNGNQKNAAYFEWANTKLTQFKGLFQTDDVEGVKTTNADAAFVKNDQGEMKNLLTAMNTLGTMSVQSIEQPGSSSGISNPG